MMTIRRLHLIFGVFFSIGLIVVSFLTFNYVSINVLYFTTGYFLIFYFFSLMYKLILQIIANSKIEKTILKLFLILMVLNLILIPVFAIQSSIEMIINNQYFDMLVLIGLISSLLIWIFKELFIIVNNLYSSH